jgi:hypothetical protein
MSADTTDNFPTCDDEYYCKLEEDGIFHWVDPDACEECCQNPCECWAHYCCYDPMYSMLGGPEGICHCAEIAKQEGLESKWWHRLKHAFLHRTRVIKYEARKRWKRLTIKGYDPADEDELPF